MEAPEANTQFSRYRIITKLGAGGMGEVFLAQDAELERNVALKILPAALAGNDDNVRRFIQEAKAASALNHPNILTVYEIGRNDDSRYIATEYIKGDTLRKRLKRGPLSLQETLDIAAQVAAALNAAHENGIVHRDIKPENVMLREDGLVKVLDFGLAKLTEKEAAPIEAEAATRIQINTEPGVVMGTTTYLSPEQARGRETDARTDIWSLGVMIYEMLAGVWPFDGETPSDVIAAILKSEPEPIASEHEEIPPELQGIVRKALQKKADERYQNVKDLLRDLKNLKRELEFTHELERSQIPAFYRKFDTASLKTAQNSGDNQKTAVLTTAETEADGAQTAGRKIGRRFVVVSALLGLMIAAFGIGGYFVFSPGTADAAINSIAVLPFQNGSGDSNLDYLSDGLSESVIDRLTLLPQFKVIARNSSFKLRGQDDLQAAAKTLGARAIVTGRVVQRDGQLMVRVELVDALDNRQIWSQVYNRRAGDAQALQDEISREIAERLQLQTSAGQVQIVRSKPVKPEAYEQLLRGRFAVRQYTPQSTQKALEFYQQAIAQDPNYALAFAEMAYTYRLIGASAFLDPGETNPKAEAAAQRSLELDDSIGLAHLVLGEIKRDQWDWRASEDEYSRAIELSPNLAEAHEGYALFFSVLGRHDRAIAEMKRAKDLDPLRLLTHISLGAVFYNARRNDDALAALRDALSFDENSPIAYAWIGIVQASRRNNQEALAAYRKAVELGDNTAATQCYYGYTLAASGKRDEALAIVSRLRSGKEFVSRVALAVLYTGLNDKQQAFEALERAYKERDPQLQYLNVEPHFDDLRGDPRFQNLVQRVGLSQ